MTYRRLVRYRHASLAISPWPTTKFLRNGRAPVGFGQAICDRQQSTTVSSLRNATDGAIFGSEDDRIPFWTREVIVTRDASATTPEHIIKRISPLPSNSNEPKHFSAVFLLTKAFANWATRDDQFVQEAIARIAGISHAGAVDDVSSYSINCTILLAVVDRLPGPHYALGSESAADDIQEKRARNLRMQACPMQDHGYEGFAYCASTEGSLLLDESSLPSEGASTSSRGRRQEQSTIPSTQNQNTLAFHMAQRGGSVSDMQSDITVIKLPLANTLFSNGQVSTMFVSQWRRTSGTTHLEKISQRTVQHQFVTLPLSREADVDISSSAQHDWNLGIADTKILLTMPLIPLTPPREITTSMGNIIRSLGDIPASQELEQAVSQYFEENGIDPQAAAVWALVIPKEVAKQHAVVDTLALAAIDKEHQRIIKVVNGETCELFSTIPFTLLLQGAKLRRVTSGGGGWGNKAGLLSLEPEIDYGSDQGLEDGDAASVLDLDRFLDESDLVRAVASPGDFVRFYISPNTDSSSAPQVFFRSTNKISGIDTIDFGVSPSTLDELHVDSAPDFPENKLPTIEVFKSHFGAMSEMGFSFGQIKQGAQVQSKIDMPYSRFSYQTIGREDPGQRAGLFTQRPTLDQDHQALNNTARSTKRGMRTFSRHFRTGRAVGAVSWPHSRLWAGGSQMQKKGLWTEQRNLGQAETRLGIRTVSTERDESPGTNNSDTTPATKLSGAHGCSQYDFDKHKPEMSTHSHANQFDTDFPRLVDNTRPGAETKAGSFLISKHVSDRGYIVPTKEEHLAGLLPDIIHYRTGDVVRYHRIEHGTGDIVRSRRDDKIRIRRLSDPVKSSVGIQKRKTSLVTPHVHTSDHAFADLPLKIRHYQPRNAVHFKELENGNSDPPTFTSPIRTYVAKGANQPVAKIRGPDAAWDALEALLENDDSLASNDAVNRSRVTQFPEKSVNRGARDVAVSRVPDESLLGIKTYRTLPRSSSKPSFVRQYSQIAGIVPRNAFSTDGNSGAKQFESFSNRLNSIGFRINVLKAMHLQSDLRRVQDQFDRVAATISKIDRPVGGRKQNRRSKESIKFHMSHSTERVAKGLIKFHVVNPTKGETLLRPQERELPMGRIRLSRKRKKLNRVTEFASDEAAGPPGPNINLDARQNHRTVIVNPSNQTYDHPERHQSLYLQPEKTPRIRFQGKHESHDFQAEKAPIIRFLKLDERHETGPRIRLHITAHPLDAVMTAEEKNTIREKARMAQPRFMFQAQKNEGHEKALARTVTPQSEVFLFRTVTSNNETPIDPTDKRRLPLAFHIENKESYGDDMIYIDDSEKLRSAMEDYIENKELYSDMNYIDKVLKRKSAMKANLENKRPHGDVMYKRRPARGGHVAKQRSTLARLHRSQSRGTRASAVTKKYGMHVDETNKRRLAIKGYVENQGLLMHMTHEPRSAKKVDVVRKKQSHIRERRIQVRRSEVRRIAVRRIAVGLVAARRIEVRRYQSASRDQTLVRRRLVDDKSTSSYRAILAEEMQGHQRSSPHQRTPDVKNSNRLGRGEFVIRKTSSVPSRRARARRMHVLGLEAETRLRKSEELETRHHTQAMRRFAERTRQRVAVNPWDAGAGDDDKESVESIFEEVMNFDPDAYIAERRNREK